MLDVRVPGADVRWVSFSRCRTNTDSDDPRKLLSDVFRALGRPEVYACDLCHRSDGPTEALEHDRSAREQRAIDAQRQQRAADLLKKRDAMMHRRNWSLQHLDAAPHWGSPNLELAMFRHIVAGTNVSRAALERQLKELRRSEPVVHLELALWKAACKLNPPVDLVHSLEWISWYHRGWKT
jgi:hypothetical protein